MECGSFVLTVKLNLEITSSKNDGFDNVPQKFLNILLIQVQLKFLECRIYVIFMNVLDKLLQICHACSIDIYIWMHLHLQECFVPRKNVTSSKMEPSVYCYNY